MVKQEITDRPDALPLQLTKGEVRFDAVSLAMIHVGQF